MKSKTFCQTLGEQTSNHNRSLLAVGQGGTQALVLGDFVGLLKWAEQEDVVNLTSIVVEEGVIEPVVGDYRTQPAVGAIRQGGKYKQHLTM